MISSWNNFSNFGDWVFLSNFNFPLYVFKGEEYLITIPPLGRVTLDYNDIQHGQILNTFAKAKNGQLVPWLKPYVASVKSRTITFGSFSYSSVPNTEQSHYFDISGVRIVNHFPVSVGIEYKGNHVATIQGHGGSQLHGGGGSSFYFDNYRNGFHTGDSITFKGLSTDFPFEISVVLTDKFCQRIDMGVASAGETTYNINDAPFQDSTVYRFNPKSSFYPPNYSWFKDSRDTQGYAPLDSKLPSTRRNLVN